MVTTPSDSELIRRYARAGDQEAFGELVGRYLGVVYHAALRQLDDRADLAADIAQQVFTLLARKASALERHATLAGWLHVATRNITRDVRRAERRRRVRESEAFAMHELSRDESTQHWDAVRPVLDSAIGALPERDRDAVVLRFFAALPLAEVGRRLGLSENAARMRVERALEKLGAELARHGVTSSAAALGAVLINPAFAAPVLPGGLAASVTTGALAGAAPMGALSSVVSFMSTTKVLGISAAMFMVLGVVGTVTHQRRVAAEAALHAAQLQHARVVESVRQAEGAAAAAEQQAAQHAGRADGARKAGAPASAPSPSSSSPVVRASREELAAEGNAFLERHPVVKQALRDYVRGSLKFQFGPIYRELGLTPDQIERFENLRGRGTGMGAATADGRPMTLMFGERPGSDHGAEVEAAIGPEAARRLRAAQSKALARYVAADVASSLYFTETPLAPDQADRLVSIVAAGRLPRDGGYDWERIMAQAGGVLSAPQLEVLAARRAGDEFHRFLNRPRGEATKR